MWRILRLVIAAAITVSVTMLAVIDTADAKRKRSAGRNYGPYGFLPGVRSPEAIEWERARRRGPDYGWYGYSPYYGYGPVGVATFYHGRWNGGSFGPCWTRTPAGMIWNCGR